MKVVSSYASNKIEIGNYSNKLQLFRQLTLFKEYVCSGRRALHLLLTPRRPCFKLLMPIN